MMCYKDMTFCSDAKQCKNAEGCYRYFSDDEAKRAEQWMKNAPVAFSSFRATCKKYIPLVECND